MAAATRGPLSASGRLGVMTPAPAASMSGESPPVAAATTGTPTDIASSRETANGSTTDGRT